jgi:hypothetical protein
MLMDTFLVETLNPHHGLILVLQKRIPVVDWLEHMYVVRFHYCSDEVI